MEDRRAGGRVASVAEETGAGETIAGETGAGTPHGGHPELAELRARVERGGAQRYHDAAQGAGKLFARERVALLVDEHSFTEDGRYANVLAGGLPADGVITGTATIDRKSTRLNSSHL